MRKGGVKLVLITGARLATLLMRMAFLPAADAYVCENGGRIYYPDASLSVALPIHEDMDWRKRHNATGKLRCNGHWSSDAMGTGPQNQISVGILLVSGIVVCSLQTGSCQSYC